MSTSPFAVSRSTRSVTSPALPFGSMREDRVLDEGLQSEPRDQAAVVQRLILDIADVQRDRAAVAVLLDREIVVQQGELLIQRHKALVALGDALEQTGQRHDHFGNAGACWMVAIHLMLLSVL